jgi:hypothetical protein
LTDLEEMLVCYFTPRKAENINLEDNKIVV